MITFPTRTPTNIYRQYTDAHFVGFVARYDNMSWDGLEFENEAQELGFKAGWDMGAFLPDKHRGYWSHHIYWAVWNKGACERWHSHEYENPYSRGGHRWRAFLAGWCAKNYELQG